MCCLEGESNVRAKPLQEKPPSQVCVRQGSGRCWYHGCQCSILHLRRRWRYMAIHSQSHYGTEIQGNTSIWQTSIKRRLSGETDKGKEEEGTSEVQATSQRVLRYKIGKVKLRRLKQQHKYHRKWAICLYCTTCLYILAVGSL